MYSLKDQDATHGRLVSQHNVLKNRAQFRVRRVEAGASTRGQKRKQKSENVHMVAHGSQEKRRAPSKPLKGPCEKVRFNNFARKGDILFFFPSHEKKGEVNQPVQHTSTPFFSKKNLTADRFPPLQQKEEET